LAGVKRQATFYTVLPIRPTSGVADLAMIPVDGGGISSI
jgi:hypothetical protein